MSYFLFKNRCEICEVGFKLPYLLERHLLTLKHKTRCLGEKIEEIGEKNESEKNDSKSEITSNMMSLITPSEISENRRRKNREKGEKIESNTYPYKYTCDFCNYSCKYPSDWVKHMNTIKHNERILKRNLDLDSEKIYNFQCFGCDEKFDKQYKLKYHKKKCCFKASMNYPEEIISNISNISYNENDPMNSTEMVKILIKENQELRNFVIEQTKEHTKEQIKQNANIIELTKTAIMNNSGGHNNNTNTNTNSHNTNSHNTQFNIQLFLNEKCKDALNLSDFIDNIQVTNEDLENNATNGFVKGISNILIENLRQVSLYERPIHCTDVKRETMYIKEEDEWKKEENTKKMCEAIQEITRKSLLQFQQWKQENPECNDLDSEAGLKYMAISMNSMAGGNRDEYYNKVIKTVAKDTTLEKNM